MQQGNFSQKIYFWKIQYCKMLQILVKKIQDLWSRKMAGGKEEKDCPIIILQSLSCTYIFLDTLSACGIYNNRFTCPETFATLLYLSRDRKGEQSRPRLAIIRASDLEGSSRPPLPSVLMHGRATKLALVGGGSARKEEKETGKREEIARSFSAPERRGDDALPEGALEKEVPKGDQEEGGRQG